MIHFDEHGKTLCGKYVKPRELNEDDWENKPAERCSQCNNILKKYESNVFKMKSIEFVQKGKEYLLLEDREYIPKFRLKNVDEIAGVPINEPMKPTEELFIKAIKYGFILQFEYKGAKDTLFSGHSRTCVPMVFGKSSKGKLLLRSWHLVGWSVSQNKHTEKIWRLFRFDRILSVTFTGAFFRLPPLGYQEHDKGMRGGIIASADFNEIRKNQQALVKANQIQNKEDVTIGSDEDKKFSMIKAKNTDTKLDLNNVLENSFITSLKDDKNIKVSLLKSIYGSKYVAILGAIGQKGSTVKIMDEKNRNIGVFKVLDTVDNGNIKKIKKVRGQSIYDLYIFEKKI